jgi:hypothetical protein
MAFYKGLILFGIRNLQWILPFFLLASEFQFYTLLINHYRLSAREVS